MKQAPFPERLSAAIREKRTPVMVGIDPSWDLLPAEIQLESISVHGKSLAAVAEAYRLFSSAILDAVADLVPIVKFQAAFFEAIGPAGMQVLFDLIRKAKQAGLIVVFDGKRNDIGNTAAAYAQGYLGEFSVAGESHEVWSADAITVNPYLGAEGIDPFLKTAEQFGTGLFVLVRTSNPGAGLLQDQVFGDRTVYQTVADWVEEWSKRSAGDFAYGAVGAVVGATVPAQVVELRRRMPHAVLLLPGYGAQGGTSADIAPAFDAHGLGAVVNNSRGLLYAYRNPRFANLAFKDASRKATEEMIADLANHTPAGALSR